MKTVQKLGARFTGCLDGFSCVDMDLKPIHANARTFNFPVGKDRHAEVVFSVQDAKEEGPVYEKAALRVPTEDEVLDAIEILYSMIATGGAVDGAVDGKGHAA